MEEVPTGAPMEERIACRKQQAVLYHQTLWLGTWVRGFPWGSFGNHLFGKRWWAGQPAPPLPTPANIPKAWMVQDDYPHVYCLLCCELAPSQRFIIMRGVFKVVLPWESSHESFTECDTQQPKRNPSACRRSVSCLCAAFAYKIGFKGDLDVMMALYPGINFPVVYDSKWNIHRHWTTKFEAAVAILRLELCE